MHTKGKLKEERSIGLKDGGQLDAEQVVNKAAIKETASERNTE